MATTFVGKSVAKQCDRLYPATLNTASLKEGAAVVYDTGNGVKAPAAAAAAGFAGLLADVMPSGGSTVGMDVNLQRTGNGMGILAAGVSCNRGDKLVINDTSGYLRKYVHGTDTNCDIIGEATMAVTGDSDPHPVGVDLDSRSYVA